MSKGNKKKTVIAQKVDGEKQTRFGADPISWLSKQPSWRFSRMDKESDRWSPVDSNNCFLDNILAELSGFEGLTWAEIEQAAGGRTHGTNNHFENISELISDAQKRATELHILEDQMFSLRIGGQRRLYGLLNDGIFTLIWYDKNHEIYPVSKK